MAHRNARLTPLTRLELVREVDAGWPQAEVARHFRVSRHTVAKWLGRFRAEGAAGLEDRSSAPRAHPRRTPPELERRICAVRRTQGFGPHRIQWALGVARSTVYAVLRRRGLNRLDRLHRVTREPVRYEHDAPGDLLHLDVKKLGRVPEGGGKRMAPGFAETRSGPHSRRSLGLEYLHVAVDDHSRYAYVSVLPDERGASCAAFLEQALAAFRRRGVRVRRVLTDNAKAYTVARSFHGAAAAQTCGCRTRGPTTRRRTAKPSVSSRSCRTSGPTPAPTAPTPSGCASSHAGSTATITADRTAASAGPSPPPACEQPSWVVHLAAYGQPTYDLDDAMRITADGYEVNVDMIAGRAWGDLRGMERRYGPRRDPDSSIGDDDRDLAASAQHQLERALFALVEDGVRRTGSRRLSFAGGVAMNSKANGRLLASGLIDEIFVQPGATDDGTAIGAAVAGHRAVGLAIPRTRQTNAYLGPEFSNEEIASTIETYKLTGYRVSNVEQVAAGLLANGHVLGWFQGRMEFGPRALDNRSILADPRYAEARDRVNASVKFREGWRPFAPSCLAEQASEYFEGCTDAPFMILTFDVLPEKRSVIPAVTHADKTARVQTVTREANPRYHQLISEFAKLTGVPVLLNTSFNLKGEPIVTEPKDSISTFYSSGLDFLVMGDHIVPKDPRWRPDPGFVGAK